MRLSPSRRAGISNGTVALVVVVIALFAFAYISLPQSSTSPNNTTAQGGAESVISLLGGYNSQTISSASVNMFTMQGGAYTKTIDSPGTVTSGTATSSTTNTYSPPWLTQCRGSAAWPLDVVTSGAGQSIAQDGTTVFTLTSGVPQGSSNNVPAYKQTCLLFPAPASGTTAVTGVEAVGNSLISQTSSFPAAFPLVSTTWNIALQVFDNESVGIQSVTLYGTSTSPLTDYSNGAAVTSSGPVTYHGYMIAAFNQTGISVSSPNGAIALSANKVSGSVAFLIPLSDCNASPSTNTKTTNPSICENVPITVQETIAATGKHIGAYFLFVGDSQAGYIESYFSTPALTSWPDADNDAGIETGFGGILLPSSANGPTVLIEQSVGAIMTY